MVVARLAESTKYSKFPISKQYFNKEVRDSFDFLHEDKHQSFPQADAILFGGDSQVCQST